MLTGELTQVQFDGAGRGSQEIHPDFAAFAMRLGIHSLLSVPLRTQDRVLGILSVARQFPQPAYTKDEQH